MRISAWSWFSQLTNGMHYEAVGAVPYDESMLGRMIAWLTADACCWQQQTRQKSCFSLKKILQFAVPTGTPELRNSRNSGTPGTPELRTPVGTDNWTIFFKLNHDFWRVCCCQQQASVSHALMAGPALINHTAPTASQCIPLVSC